MLAGVLNVMLRFLAILKKELLVTSSFGAALYLLYHQNKDL